ncbi:MAG: S-layer homology domain-containing protein [Defluviitaleaceae bacterium]|nr:S-layer homology domain-containing protein [Defluviitaleaceae bacterium]
MKRNEGIKQGKIPRKALSLLVALLCVLAIIPVHTAHAADLSSASEWAHEGIAEAITTGLVPQHLQSLYTQPTTRAEFTTLAVAVYERVQGEITGRVTFADTDDVNVQKMAYLGVVTGVGENMFNPDGELTREQAAVMLSRLSDAIGQPFPTDSPPFADNDIASDWALSSIGRVYAAGLMSGTGNNMFSPQNPFTREQSIITFLRLYNMAIIDLMDTQQPLAYRLEAAIIELTEMYQDMEGVRRIWFTKMPPNETRLSISVTFSGPHFRRSDFPSLVVQFVDDVITVANRNNVFVSHISVGWTTLLRTDHIYNYVSTDRSENNDNLKTGTFTNRRDGAARQLVVENVAYDDLPMHLPTPSLPRTLQNSSPPFDVTIRSIEVTDVIVTEIGGRTARYTARTGSQWVILDVSVRNTGTNSAHFISSFYPKMLFDGNVRYNPIPLAGHPGDLRGSIAPLATRTGIIAFEIPNEVIRSGRPLIFRLAGGAEYSFTPR